MAELEEEQDFVARRKQLKEERDRNVDRYQVAARGVLADLGAAGFEVESIADLVRSGTTYAEAVPILVRWLRKVEDPWVKEDIVRTLSVPWATDAASTLIAEFEHVEDPTGTGLRWTIGNALEVLARDEIAEQMISLARKPEYGVARQMVVLGLGKLTDPRVVPILIDLLEDEDVMGHAVMALGKLRATEARKEIALLLSHPKPWVRKESRRALARIDEVRSG